MRYELRAGAAALLLMGDQTAEMQAAIVELREALEKAGAALYANGVDKKSTEAKNLAIKVLNNTKKWSE